MWSPRVNKCERSLKQNFYQFRLPDPAGEFTALPQDPLAGFKGPTSKGWERRRGEGVREGERGVSWRPKILKIDLRSDETFGTLFHLDPV